jgi:hypothetical protein
MPLTFRRLIGPAIAIALLATQAPLIAAPGSSAGSTGYLSGTMRTVSGQPIAGANVQLRNVLTGMLAGTTTSGVAGDFNFTALAAGSYLVELVDASGQVVGTSSLISLSAAAMVASGVTVAAPAQATGAGGKAFFKSTAGIITLVAVGVGIAGLGLALSNNDNNPSPSQ